MSEKLRPCPFCGEEVTLVKDIWWFADHRAESSACDVTGPSATDEDDAIKLWNTRPVEDALIEVIQEYLDWGAMTQSDRYYFEQKFTAALALARGE